MKKHLFALFLCIIYSFFITTTTFAARSIVISSDKLNLINEEEMIVSASISGFRDDERVYIKGAFYADGGTNYFGFTKNNDLWIKNSETALKQREVLIGSWDKTVIIKSDYLDTGFAGKGDYNFKLGFYYITSGGNISSINWSDNILKISLDPPQPSSSNTPTPTEYKNYQKINTITPTPTLSNLFTVTPRANISNRIDSSTKSSNFDKIQSEIKRKALESKNVLDDPKDEDVKVLGTSDEKDFSFIWIATGLIFIISGIGFFGYKYAKDKNII